MSALDFYLYYDEDHDLDADEMTEFTPVEPAHLVELYEQGLLMVGEVFSHKGWHHQIEHVDQNGTIRMSMWDGPTGDERQCSWPQLSDWI